jgi:hypothetical protein
MGTMGRLLSSGFFGVFLGGAGPASSLRCLSCDVWRSSGPFRLRKSPHITADRVPGCGDAYPLKNPIRPSFRSRQGRLSCRLLSRP